MNEIKKVLFVDDEPDIRTLVDITISTTASYEVDFAENGQELLDKLEVSNPDLILLDVRMPVMDGITALKHMREKGINTPVIILTAEVLTHEMERYETLDILGVIKKPFDPIEFVQQIEKIWNENFNQGAKV